MGTLVPVVGLVQVGSQSMADRYTYLPLIGIFIIVAWGMPRGMLEKRVPKLVATAAAAALLGFCAVKCRSQIGYWKNSETLLRHDIEVTGDNWLACNNLALALCEAGKQQEAMEYFAQALRLRPDYAESHFNLGLALAGLGRVPEAIEYWENAVRIKPDYAEAHYNLGLALEQTGKIGDAAQHWAQAIHVRPDFVEARNKLAWLLATVPPMEGGDPLEAVNLAEGTCKLTDNRVPMYLDTLAAAYAAAGRLNDAIVTAQKAIDLARSAGQTQLVSELEGRLQLYRAGQPYRQPVSR
jgi:tetratricopeptide (TPR) repeat protein